MDILLYAALLVGATLCAIQAIRARRLLAAALWLAGTSVLVAITLYLIGAHEVAVIELSVGAGLVTVLFVFAISIAGEEAMDARAIVPRPAAWTLIILAVLLLGWMALPMIGRSISVAEPPFAAVLWQDRGLDVLVQVVLLFAGVLGLMGLLAEAKEAVPQQGAETPMPKPIPYDRDTAGHRPAREMEMPTANPHSKNAHSEEEVRV